MNKIIFALLLCLVIAGCGDPVDRTPKEQLQKVLLREFEGCENKFGSNDYEHKRQANIQYCRRLIEVIEQKIDEGFFDETFKKEFPDYIDIDTSWETSVDEHDVDKAIFDIVGDI